MSEEKIGMYSIEEIYEELANGFLHHSMVDAMYFKIKDLQQKVEQLENIRKEAIKLIEEDILGKKIENVNWDYDECDYSDMPVERIKPLLNILMKGGYNGK